MLKIDNLHATVAGKEILKGLSLEVKAGEVHAIMGPNGAGKSTLGNILAGREGYEVTAGSVEFDGKPLLDLAPEERAAAGVFLAFQYPVEIPGVNNTYFLRAAANAQRKARGESELDSMQFLKRCARSSPCCTSRTSCCIAASTKASAAARRSATRSSSSPCWNRSWRSWTRPIPAWTSMR
jgi:FeS assembly ATPase SufC